jgi:hypothetical protein
MISPSTAGRYDFDDRSERRFLRIRPLAMPDLIESLVPWASGNRTLFSASAQTASQAGSCNGQPRSIAQELSLPAELHRIVGSTVA